MSVATHPVTEAAPLISLDEYRALFRNHPGGVAVVTVDGDRPAGFTATSVISISANPPMLVFSIDRSSSSWPIVEHANSAVVHLLHVENRDLATRFATSGIDRFEGLSWTQSSSGAPLVSGVETWASGTFVSKTEFGSAAVIVMQIEESSAGASHRPLVYHARTYHELSSGSTLL